MTELEGLALRCILPGFEGAAAPAWVLRRAAEGLGGVVLFARNVETRGQLAELTAELHRSRPELLVAIDEEGGEVTRLEARSGSYYPGNLALGVADDTALTREVAAAIGSELSESGIDLNLAPVADVNSNAQNPIIGVRSFGSDSRAVARQTAAWVEGMQGAGVAACVKHFPGHGDTSMDSHLELPVANEIALEPFAAAIDAGARAVMSAHIVVPELDSAPATASRRIMTDLLRDQLGFDGVAVSDGLEMRGSLGDGSIGEAAVRALRAGCDALVVGGGLATEDVVDAIVAALAGDVDQARLRQAASRVDELAAWRSQRAPSATASREVGLEAARRAVRSEGEVRVGADATVLRFPSEPSIAAGPVPWGLAEALAARGVRVTASEVDPAAHDLAVPLKGDVVVVVRDLHRHPEQADLIAGVLRKRPHAVLVEMGLPMCRPAAALNYIATHGSARVCAQAAAEVMHR
jgi:beta-N-acetylhexosaminidase